METFQIISLSIILLLVKEKDDRMVYRNSDGALPKSRHISGSSVCLRAILWSLLSLMGTCNCF